MVLEPIKLQHFQRETIFWCVPIQRPDLLTLYTYMHTVSSTGTIRKTRIHIKLRSAHIISPWNF